MASPDTGFEILWELDSPTRPDLYDLCAQLDVMGPLASMALVPDNHTGRATVSSVSVARRVQDHGLTAIACLNARDRNLLGLRRDLLTATVDGVNKVLLVYGDEPDIGVRSPGLGVRTMLDECRAHTGPLDVGVTSRLRPLPAWKGDADRLLVQVGYDVDALLRWRDSVEFHGPIHPAVLVVASSAMARRLSARIPELAVPDTWIAALDRDPQAGVRLAADLVTEIMESGAFTGIHLVTGRRYRETAAELVDRGLLPGRPTNGSTLGTDGPTLGTASYGRTPTPPADSVDPFDPAAVRQGPNRAVLSV